MRIAVLGTGSVGQALATGLERIGEDVVLGTRDPSVGAAAQWAERARGSAATFAEAAERAELVVLALNGGATLEVVRGLGRAADGKVVLDATNPLDFSAGFPPRLFTAPGTSLAEQVQEAIPGARVVKALNTVHAAVMVDPGRIPGDHTLPLAGDDGDAKARVRDLLGALGWPDGALLDLGGLAAARAMEAYVLFWVELFSATGTPDVSVRVVTGESPR
jgi:8-hydroxy-5-deazaflavin:NADPH oxidoreductase